MIGLCLMSAMIRGNLCKANMPVLKEILRWFICPFYEHSSMFCMWALCQLYRILLLLSLIELIWDILLLNWLLHPCFLRLVWNVCSFLFKIPYSKLVRSYIRTGSERMPTMLTLNNDLFVVPKFLLVLYDFAQLELDVDWALIFVSEKYIDRSYLTTPGRLHVDGAPILYRKDDFSRISYVTRLRVSWRQPEVKNGGTII